MLVGMSLDSFMAAASESYIIIMPLVVLYLLLRRNKNVYPFVLSIVLALAIITLVKISISEPRPCAALGGQICEDPYESFPSRHAAVIATGFLFLLTETPVLVAYIAYFLLVCFSRAYLNQHYPHDVVAGALIGLAIGYACWKLKDRIINAARRAVKRIGAGRYLP